MRMAGNSGGKPAPSSLGLNEPDRRIWREELQEGGNQVAHDRLRIVHTAQERATCAQRVVRRAQQFARPRDPIARIIDHALAAFGKIAQVAVCDKECMLQAEHLRREDVHWLNPDCPVINQA